MNKLIILFCLSLMNFSIDAQELSKQVLSPNGIFDKVYDRFGNNFSLDEIRVKKDQKKKNNDKTALLCSAGYFDLYFEENCGMKGNSAIELDRRNVICQLFNDLSQFIIPVNPSTRVNIWVRDISTIVANPSSSGVLGLASGYYTLPANAPTSSGIVDNEIWKTINSGTNSYTNVTSPFISSDGPNPLFFHGMMAFNFSNPTINWHTNLTQTTASGLYDLYTIALHETTHALGFASLIDSNGNSKLGINNQYYSRYDLFLNTSSSIPLITSTGGCSLYGFGFNSALNSNVMSPSNTDCNSHIQFTGSINQTVYTPSVFAPPSSLSHLEDLCHTPTNHPDNEYYVMSDANGLGPAFMKRYLKAEERSVLCDIGYQLNTTFGNASNLNDVIYGGSTCLGNQIAGINDGIDNSGSFQHIVTNGNNITLSYSDILQNDFNAVSFECLEDIYNHGSLNSTSGTSFTFTATSPGLALLRYIPVSNTGNRGNITYIFIYVQNGNCSTTACNIVNNGGFENGENCGQLYSPFCSNPLIAEIYCWTQLCATADYFVRNCHDTICLTSFTDISVPSTHCLPPAETWNSNSTINNKFMGIGSAHNQWSEGMQVSLLTPLQPNIAYTLKFVARIANDNWTYQNLPGDLVIAGSPSLLAPINIGFSSLPPVLTPLSHNIIPNNNEWNHYEVTIMNTSGSSLNYLSVINAGYFIGNPELTKTYILIDDISITETNQLAVLNLPDSICTIDPIPALDLFLSPAPSGGVFTGNGVSFDGVNYSFDPEIAGIGNHQVTYTYTTNLGCPTTIYDSIFVNPLPNVILANFNPDTLCINASSVTLPNGSPTGGNYSGPGIVGGNFDPSFAGVGIHHIIYTYTDGNSCTNSDYDSIFVNPLPNVILVNFNPDTLCINASSVTLPNGSPTGGNYSGYGIIGGNFDPSSAGVGVHHIIYTYTDGNSCINSDTTIITVDVCAGIDNITTDFGIIIYPNPSTGQFTIEKPSDLNKAVKVQLLDATSKLILEKIITIGQQKVEMDIRNYSKGIYYLQIIIEDEIFVKQILKN